MLIIIIIIINNINVLAFKCMSGLALRYLSDQLITRSIVSTRKTRNSPMLNIPLFRSATGLKTFHYRIVNIWNNLDNNIKLSIDVSSFRNKLGGTLLGNLRGTVINMRRNNY